VAGYEGPKAEISETVDFLRSPARYRRAGATPPRGVLMIGPPGTGKTLLARAVAGEADVPFFSVVGSSFVEMHVGVGAARVRDLFSEARKRAPAITFIDELDAIGQKRAGSGQVSNDEREQTLNQLLSEMDGFDPAEGIVVLAATNRLDVLDPALLRPGRFDRQITIPLPNVAERTAILAVHCRGKRLDPGVDLSVVARRTPGLSGADLANLAANEAAICAARDDREVLLVADFDTARGRILLGGRRQGSNVLLPEEKHSVAVHESGHALVAALSPRADPVAKATILPAGQALGVTEQLPVVERHLYSEEYLNQTLAERLAGPRKWWSSARAPPGRPTTWPPRPTWPPEWSGSSGCRPSWARSAIRKGGPSISAGAGRRCPAGHSPKPPRRSSTARCPGCCAKQRTARPSYSAPTRPSCASSLTCCRNRRRWTVTEFTGSSQCQRRSRARIPPWHRTAPPPQPAMTAAAPRLPTASATGPGQTRDDDLMQPATELATMDHDDWRVTISFPDRFQAERATALFSRHQVAQDARRRLGCSIAMGASGSQIFLYTGAEAAARDVPANNEDDAQKLADQISREAPADATVRTGHAPVLVPFIGM